MAQHAPSASWLEAMAFLALGPLLGRCSAELARGAGANLSQTSSDLICGTHWAVCYSGFRKGQHPDRGSGAVNPTDAEVLEDLQILLNHNFSLIRLYDSGDNSEVVLRLIRTHGLALKVLLGAWLDAEMNNPGTPWHPAPLSEKALAANKRKNHEEVGRLIYLANEYSDIVAAVEVGNEALVSWNDHMVPVESVMSYVGTVKCAVGQPVSVADNYDFWAKHGQVLAKELDFVSVHIYPEWEGKTVEEALEYGKQNLAAVRRALPDSRLVITEAGWATEADEFGARAGEAQQKRYYWELFEWSRQANITVFWFEAFDESWKGDPSDPDGAEKHWGIFTEDRRPKAVMRGPAPALRGQGAGKAAPAR